MRRGEKKKKKKKEVLKFYFRSYSKLQLANDHLGKLENAAG